MLANLSQQIDTLKTVTVPNMSQYAWIYIIGIGEERPFIVVPYELFAASDDRLYSTVPGGDAVNFQIVVSYKSNTSISYRTSKGVKGARVYGVGRRA